MQAISPGGRRFDVPELEALFGLLGRGAVSQREVAGGAAREVRLVEHMRAHNLAITLAGEEQGFS